MADNRTPTYLIGLEVAEGRDRIAQLLNGLAERVPFQRASIQLVTGDTRSLFVTRGFSPRNVNRALMRPISHDALISSIIESAEALFLTNPFDNQYWHPESESADIRSWIGAPITLGYVPVGLLTADFLTVQDRIEQYREDVRQFVAEAGPILSLAGHHVARQLLARDMEIVKSITQVIGTHLDPRQVLRTIAQQVAEGMDCSHCTIFLPQKRGNHVWLVAEEAGPKEDTKSREFRSEEGLAGWVFTHGQTINTGDAANDTRFSEARKPRPTHRSMLVVPIRVGDQITGVISADQDYRDWFTDSDARLVEVLANQAGIAIQRSVAFQLLQDIASRILALRDAEEILLEVVRRAITLVNATTGVIYLFDPSGNHANAAEWQIKKFPPGFVHPDPRLDNPNGITRTVISTGKAVRIHDLKQDPRVHEKLKSAYNSLIAVPLIRDERVIGVFFVDDENPHDFTDTEEFLLGMLASNAVIALDKAEQLRQQTALEAQLRRLREIVHTDLDPVLKQFGEGIRQIFGKEVSPTINLYDAETDTFEDCHAYGPLANELREPPRPNGTGRYVVTTGTAVYVPNINAQLQGVPSIREKFASLIVSFAAIPLSFQDRTLGVLYVNSQKALEFNREERERLQTFADQVAERINLVRLPRQTLRLRDLAVEFLKSAGRTVTLKGPTELSVPEPAVIASRTPAAQAEAVRLADLIGNGTVGYFMYEGALQDDVQMILDSSGIRGKSIVPLPYTTMTAALADGNALAVLEELERSYKHLGNLFERRSALVEERFLFGRRELLAEVRRKLLHGEHVLIFGLRKSGKTSFLNILRQHFAAHPVSYIDLQKFDRTTEQWPIDLFGQIVSAFDRWGRAEFADWPESPAPPENASDLQNALLRRRAWQLERKRTERFLIVFDEMERIFPNRSSEDQVRRFVNVAGALRSLTQLPEQFVSVATADLRPDVNRWNQLNASHTNPLYSYFHEVPMSLLSFSAVEEMMKSIGRAMGIKFIEEGFIEHVFERAGGHPFLTRMIAGAAYDQRTRNSQELTRTALDDGIDALEDLYKIGSFFQQNFWDQLRDKERSILQSVAGNLYIHDSGVMLPAARESIKETAADRVLLVALGLLSNDRIQMGLFSEWVKNRPPEEDARISDSP